MIDESTDVAVMKQLVLVIRYLTDTGASTSFVHIGDIIDGTAATIHTSIVKHLDDRGIPLHSLRAFGSDGAAVMTGKKSGVGARLKANCPHLIQVHCVNHRLALAAAHAANEIPYLQKFKTNILSLYHFYHNSPVRTSGLHAIQEVLSDPVIKCKEAKDVRWLSHEHAVKAILRTLPSLITSLDREASERSEPTARGLLKFICTYEFVACVSLLSDVLPHLNRLSALFQTRDINLTMLQTSITATTEVIKSYEAHPGPRLSDVNELIKTRLQDFRIEVSDTKRDNFTRSVQQPYIGALIDHINARFPNVAELEAFSIFDPKQLPDNKDELLSYGKEKLNSLKALYGAAGMADIDDDAADSEWEAMKQLLHSNYRRFTMASVVDTVLTDSSFQAMFPQMRKLIAILAILPISTAECERAFSTMNRIKTDLRNRMKTPTLESLMHISITGPPLQDFDFSEAADVWGKMRNRRISV